MPTYTFTRTREQLRDRILRKLGVLAAGETATPEDATLVYEAMDLRLKEMHALQVLWFNTAGAATDLTLSAVTANAPADLLFPVSLHARVNGEDCSIRLIGHTEYQAIPNKADTGQPEVAFFAAGVFRLWPVPEQSYTGRLTYEQIAADTAANTAPDVAVSMLRAFAVIVAADLADDFQLPEAKVLRLKAEAKTDAWPTIRALNVERVEPATIAPDYF